MKSHIKKKWLEALRSGEYRKARETLHNRKQDTYCCLGVLQRIVGAEIDDHVGLLGRRNSRKTGLTQDDQLKLARLNDSTAGWTKAVEYIEEKL